MIVWDNWSVGDVTGSTHNGSGVGGGQNVAVGVSVAGTLVDFRFVFVGKIIGMSVWVASVIIVSVDEAVQTGVYVDETDAVTINEAVGVRVSVGDPVSV